MCYEEGKLNVEYAFRAWSGAVSRQWMALIEAESPSVRRGKNAPDTFGLNQWWRRLSPKFEEWESKRQVVVTPQSIGWREPAKAFSELRTPRLYSWELSYTANY